VTIRSRATIRILSLKLYEQDPDFDYWDQPGWARDEEPEPTCHSIELAAPVEVMILPPTKDIDPGDLSL
jgi:hypothetical protein